MRKHKASIMKTEMKIIIIPKIKTKGREIRSENSNKKRKYVQKEFARIMRRIIGETKLKQAQEKEFEYFQAVTVGKM